MPKATHTLTATLAPPTIDLAKAVRSCTHWLAEQALDLIQPDHTLLTACAEFRRLDAVLQAIPYDREAATDTAWAARQAVANRIANLRPETDPGRRERAAIAVTLMLEIPDWQQDAEVRFALRWLRTEARA